jgi:Domain of unknown function (DUF4082)/Fibronectin type III domain
MSSRTTRGPHRCRFTTWRCSRPMIDHLESRAMLSTTVVHPTFVMVPMGGGPPAGAYSPAQILQAYGFNSISFNGAPGTGKRETIAIVDAYDDPKIQSDLNVFDSQFGLAPTTVIRVNQTGGTSYPASDSSGGWELEESLDVEWAHAIAPQASIMLVEANSATDTDLLAAVKYAAAHANVVSMSWGGSEFSGETSDDSAYFAKAGVVFVASSGDSGAPASWPAASPNVLSVGGTALTLGASNAWSSEAGWNESGGGPSASEPQPAYQKGVVTQTSKARGTPDVAYDASPSTGFAVYDSVPYSGTTYGWLGVGGTSAGAPQWAALMAIADQGRAASGQAAINSTNPQEVMNVLYKNPGDFHDITSGTSLGQPHYSAGLGYDYVTGLGSPIANLVVGSFAGTSTTAPADTLALAATTAETAGVSFSLTVTAENSSGATDTGYLGTVHFTSGDVQASLPANYTFTAADHGTHTFTVALKTAGGQSITATDTTTSAVTGTLSGLTVSPAAASQFILSGLSSTATVGVAQTVTVTAKDPYGNVASGYAGTVQFTSSDAAASLPAKYPFTTADLGVHAFTFTFGTAGTQSLSVTDTTSQFTAIQSGITVAPAAPINLVASAVSSSQINLTWTGSSGATGYLIQQSTSGTTSWTQVGSTSGGSKTTFQQTGLSAGTTYYYRVLATLGSVDSSYSNVASATTTGTAATADSIWSNTYVPSEDAYSRGSYEVGVKFTSSVSGLVTGARFYKQTWMGGYLHVGHLWSSAGALLASATFTNESASGWQQVTFSSPVAIQANAVYIVSFSTGGGYFGITTSFFTKGGVSSGPLQALPGNVTGGDGVYGTRAGAFPNVNGGGMNFWADVAFTPSSSGSSTAKAFPAATTTGGFGMSALTTGQSNRLVTSAPGATPTGPAGSFAGWRGTTVAIPSSTVYRRPIAQADTMASTVKTKWQLDQS